MGHHALTEVCAAWAVRAWLPRALSAIGRGDLASRNDPEHGATRAALRGAILAAREDLDPDDEAAKIIDLADGVVDYMDRGDSASSNNVRRALAHYDLQGDAELDRTIPSMVGRLVGACFVAEGCALSWYGERGSLLVHRDGALALVSEAMPDVLAEVPAEHAAGAHRGVADAVAAERLLRARSCADVAEHAAALGAIDAGGHAAALVGPLLAFAASAKVPIESARAAVARLDAVDPAQIQEHLRLAARLYERRDLAARLRERGFTTIAGVSVEKLPV
jgi:hypothetical protein